MNKEELSEMAEKDPHRLVVETLREIAEARGRYTHDPHIHAVNTIKDMQDLAFRTLFAIHEITQEEIAELKIGS